MSDLAISDAGLTTDIDAPQPIAEEIERCKVWIELFCSPRKTINETKGSYGLKHAVERWHDSQGAAYSYVANGAFIKAAVDLGYRYSHDGGDSPNCSFNMKFPRRRTDLYRAAFGSDLL